jgi:hypothetical protein
VKKFSARKKVVFTFLALCLFVIATSMVALSEDGIVATPQNIVSTVTTTQITISWDAVADATGYDIEADGQIIDNGTSTSFLHDGLQPGTAHTYKVRAKKDSVLGEWSSPTAAATSFGVPGTPTNIHTTSSELSISLNWDPVAGATSYDIEADGVIQNMSQTSFVHNGLTPLTEHRYKIRAVSTEGSSEWTEEIAASTIMNPPAVPANIRTISKGTSITVLWDSVEKAVSYDIQMDTTLVSVTESVYNHDNLAPDTQHTYKVRSVNAGGAGEWSSEITATTLPFTAGAGTPSDPYMISSGSDLEKIQRNLTAHYRLANDIDLAGVEWSPIGSTTAAPFTGSFDGAGYKLSNLTINKPGKDYMGLFGCANNATFKNINLENVNITAGGYIGALVGNAAGTSVIDNCTVTGMSSIAGGGTLGGLAGGFNGIITGSCANLNITGTNTGIGGLVGTGVCNISRSYATGNVTGRWSVGGLIGAVSGTKTIENSFALGNVKATDNSLGYVGGLVGNGTNMVIRNCYATGQITGYPLYIGGIIGETMGAVTLTSCYYDGVASGYIPLKVQDVSRLATDMKRKVTFTGWDFTGIWDVEEDISYPYLRGLPVPTKAREGLPVNDVAGGKGTIENPYLISTKEQLNNVRFNLTAHYRLANDIDLSGVEWNPIGLNAAAPFTGSFDGDGYKISNLTINKSGKDYLGLFGCASNAIFKNISVSNVSITGQNNVGSLVGIAVGTTTVDNCVVTGTCSISANGMVGGLAGDFSGSIIGSCASVGITGTGTYAGGLVGKGICNIARSYAAGNVTGVAFVGGLIGEASGTKVLENCYAFGNVKSTSTSYAYAGGLVGNTSSLIIKNSYSTGNVSFSKNTYSGGLLGYSSSVTITNCYFDSQKSGFTTPTAQARTTAQLMQQTTFTSWDFASIWNIDENNTYPFLKSLNSPTGLAAINLTNRSVTLAWNAVVNAASYEIEADGAVIADVAGTTYVHDNLAPGTRHVYRVSVKYPAVVSKWSNRLYAITLLDTPENIIVTPNESAITVTWNPVAGATSYVVEVDGQETDNGNNTTFVHSGLALNTQHVYRIKAKNAITQSAWSDVFPTINWSQTSPGISLAVEKWPGSSAGDNSTKVTVKANGFSDMYTIQMELQYDTHVLDLDADVLMSMLQYDEQNEYRAITVDEQAGRIKILFSKTGNTASQEGQFDVISLSFAHSTDGVGYITPTLVKVVDSTGKYIDILLVNKVGIWVFE